MCHSAENDRMDFKAVLQCAHVAKYVWAIITEIFLYCCQMASLEPKLVSVAANACALVKACALVEACARVESQSDLTPGRR